MWQIIGRTIVTGTAPAAINSFCGLIKSVYKNFDTKVIPEEGSVLYCGLIAGVAEHSGIYVDNNRIVHLNGNGKIEIVTPSEFLSSFALRDIYVSCTGDNAVGSKYVAKRALSMVCKKRSYNLILDNCHQFTSGCLTGNFENSDNFLTFLKMQTEKTFNADTWHLWDS